MLRSMYSGISGLKNHQTKLDVIGNNISNVNTYGFKKGRVVFKDLISQTTAGASAPTATRGGVNPKQVGLGSQLAAIDTIHGTGALQTTSRTLDLAISGDGFFQVADGVTGIGFTNTQFTRAGNFYMDREGYLVNGDGKYLVGYDANTYLVDGDGNHLNDQGVVIDPANGNPLEGLRVEEGKIYYGVGEPGTPAKVTGTVKDSAGNDLPLDTEIEINLSTGQLYFNDSEGKKYIMNSDSTVVDGNGEAIDPAPTLTFVPNNLYTTVTTTVESFSSVLTELMPIKIPVTAQSMSIGQDGTVNFVDKDGVLLRAGQIQLAKFPNTGGLEKVGSNYYQQSANSGEALLGFATEMGIGSIESGFLEMSNVDLSEEFTEMIVAQRGFQANSRIITTSDQILEELVNLKR